MFYLGIIALVQICILPGIIVTNLLRLRENSVLISVLVFLFSLVINYLIVFTLTGVGLYSRNVLLFIVLVEIVFIVYQKRASTTALYSGGIIDQIRKYADITEIKHGVSGSRIRIALLVAYAIIISAFVYLHVVGGLGNVFTLTDAVVLWNHWAGSWYAGDFPNDSFEYPQLLPAIWSITYIFIGTSDIQLFAVSIMPLFGLLIALLFWQLSYDSKDTVYLLAGIIFIVFLELVFFPFIGDGYADIPVTAFNFAALYLLLLARNKIDIHVINKLVLIGFALCGAAVATKQTGLFIYMSYPVLAWFLIYKYKARSHYIKTIIYGNVLALAICAPWNIYTEIILPDSAYDTNVDYLVSGIHKDRDYFERAEFSYMLIADKAVTKIGKFVDVTSGSNDKLYLIPKVIVSIFMIFVIASLFNRRQRPVHIIYTIPAFLSWVFLFGYDIRNLLPSVPFLSMSCAFGVSQMMPFLGIGEYKTSEEKLRQYESTAAVSRLSVVATIVLLLIVIFYGNKYTTESLYDIQIENQRKIGDPELNNLIYQYNDSNAITGKIHTNYELLEHLPGLEHLNVTTWRVSESLVSMESFNRIKDEASYFLFNTGSEEVLEFIDERIRQGDYEIVFKHKRFTFIKNMDINRR